MTDLILPPEIQAERDRMDELCAEIAHVFTRYWQWVIVQPGMEPTGIMYLRWLARQHLPITDDPHGFYASLLAQYRTLKLRVSICKALGVPLR